MDGFFLQGTYYSVDQHGYLTDRLQWTREVGEYLATQDGITLNAEHWRVIHYLRMYFEDYGIIPPMRLLLKNVGHHLGTEKASSRYLYQLFPQGVSRQAARYGGLPRPKKCR